MQLVLDQYNLYWINTQLVSFQYKFVSAQYKFVSAQIGTTQVVCCSNTTCIGPIRVVSARCICNNTMWDWTVQLWRIENYE